MKKLIFSYTKLMTFFVIYTVSFPLHAQEYATDRMFMKQFKKAKCLRSLGERIDFLKTKREMTLEHEVLLNQNVWNKLRAELPLSPGERKRLWLLKNKGFSSNKLSSKKLWAKKATKFKSLRKKCN